jgi:hypothetical protein
VVEHLNDFPPGGHGTGITLNAAFSNRCFGGYRGCFFAPGQPPETDNANQCGTGGKEKMFPLDNLLSHLL